MYSSKQRRRIIYWVAIGVVGVLAVAVFAFSVGKWMTGAAQADSPALITDVAEPELLPTEEGALESSAPEDASSTAEATAVPHAQKEAPVAEPVIVYISGAVLRPETYRLPAEARVKDVVLAAGGLTSDADSEHINLAEHISDAEHIYIPRIGEQVTPSISGGTAPEATSKAGENDPNHINLNTASAAEIEALPKIGAALAQRIIDWRTANGPFQSPIDVEKVKGISPAIYDAIKDKITVE